MSTVTPPQPTEGRKIVEDATCTFCGCLCDDIALEVQGNRITHARNACTLGETWFCGDRPAAENVCLIDGEFRAVEDGIETARADSGQCKVSARSWPLSYNVAGAARRRIDRRFDWRLRRYVESCRSWSVHPGPPGDR